MSSADDYRNYPGGGSRDPQLSFTNYASNQGLRTEIPDYGPNGGGKPDFIPHPPHRQQQQQEDNRFRDQDDDDDGMGMSGSTAYTYQLPPPGRNSKPSQEEIARSELDMHQKRTTREDQRTTGCGEFWRAFYTANQLAYLALVTVQALTILVMISIVFAKIQDNIIHTNARLRSVVTYLAIFIFAEILEIIYALDALRLKNTIQLLFLCAFNISIMIYGCLVPEQISDALKPTQPSTCRQDPENGQDPDLTCFGVNKLYDDVRGFLLVIPIVAGAASFVMAWLTWRLYAEFGWDIYKKIGADIQLKTMYFYYQIFVCFLKFDFFFFIGFTMQYLILVLSGTKAAEFGITIAALPVTVGLLIIAAVTVRLEVKWLMQCIFIGELGGCAYFIYKLFRLFESSQAQKYRVARKALAVFSIVSIGMLLLTMISSVICYRNFGRGLRDQIPPYFPSLRSSARRKRAEQEEQKIQITADGPSDPRVPRVGTRMSLD